MPAHIQKAAFQLKAVSQLKAARPVLPSGGVKKVGEGDTRMALVGPQGEQLFISICHLASSLKVKPTM